MIVNTGRKTWVQLLFTYRYTVMRRVWKRWASTILWSVALSVLHLKMGLFNTVATLAPFSLMGLALSIFLGFRNNTSYDRFWEGRKLWGKLVNTSRTLSRQYVQLLDLPADASDADLRSFKALQKRLVYHLVAYVHALRLNLRGESFEPLQEFLEPDVYTQVAQSSNPPMALARLMGEDLHLARKQEWVTPFNAQLLESGLTTLLDIQGGCERILKTPIPFAYNVLLHRLVAIYCFALPFGIVDTLGYSTPFVASIVAYGFLGLDAIGDSIENPFEREPHDLPLDALSRMIEINIMEQYGEAIDKPLLEADSTGLLL